MERKPTGWALWLFALTPVLSLALIYGFVLFAGLQLRRWPQPYNPDPKEVGGLLYDLAVFGVTLPVGALAAVPLCLVRRWRRGLAERSDQVAAMVFLVSLIAWFALLRLDPGSFAYWLAD
jgi:hypothetical protein